MPRRWDSWARAAQTHKVACLYIALLSKIGNGYFPSDCSWLDAFLFAGRRPKASCIRNIAVLRKSRRCATYLYFPPSTCFTARTRTASVHHGVPLRVHQLHLHDLTSIEVLPKVASIDRFPDSFAANECSYGHQVVALGSRSHKHATKMMWLSKLTCVIISLGCAYS